MSERSQLCSRITSISTTCLEHACHGINSYANACRLQRRRECSSTAQSTYVFIHETRSSITAKETGKTATCTRSGGQLDQSTSDVSTTSQARLRSSHCQSWSRSTDCPCNIRILLNESFDATGCGFDGSGDARHGWHNVRKRDSSTAKGTRICWTRASHCCHCKR